MSGRDQALEAGTIEALRREVKKLLGKLQEEALRQMELKELTTTLQVRLKWPALPGRARYGPEKCPRRPGKRRSDMRRHRRSCGRRHGWHRRCRRTCRRSRSNTPPPSSASGSPTCALHWHHKAEYYGKRKGT